MIQVPHIHERAARVPPTIDVGAHLGVEFGRLVNLSASGALVRTRVPFRIGRQCPLFLSLWDSSATLLVRVVRTQAVGATIADVTPELQEYLVAVMFTALESTATGLIKTLCGAAFTRTE